ncbi:hypothetical protein EPUS_05496 [Endocarpon pusillum Z07020]|uniref:Rhodopsin domain-containing protein n=1 Tax=Endocarpon pusillum (strain Z07020 / HMAS-L-300199) TaxID=1263415 RepID=U1FYF4_ENDPU|nr:uncharacterized protein EPUS_05496 [Endocarpon pusillum Z07020]ERF69952.1 hypothetical protein EPUS_05496 [Endocarpon pusillum Z07020]
MSINASTAALVGSLPVSFLEQLSGIPPPPGQMSNFVDPPNLIATTAVVVAISVFLMIIAVSLRVYSKQTSGRAFSWEDYTCFLAVVGCFTYSGVTVYGTIHNGFGVHEWNVRVSTLVSDIFLQMTLFNAASYPLIVLMAKLSILILYLRLFERNKGTKILTWIGILACSIFYTFGMLFALISCSPWPGETRLVGLASERCVRVIIYGYVTTAFNVLSDFYLVIIPIPAIIKLNMTTEKKIRVSAIFMLGILACACAIVNSYFRVILTQTLDLTYATAPVLLISIVEINVGIMVGCMPVIQPAIINRVINFFNIAFIRSLLSRLSFSSKASSREVVEGSTQVPKASDKPHLETRILHGVDGNGNFIRNTAGDGMNTQRSWFRRAMLGTWTTRRNNSNYNDIASGIGSTRATNSHHFPTSDDNIVVMTSISTDARSSQEHDPHRQYLQHAERVRNLV